MRQLEASQLRRLPPRRRSVALATAAPDGCSTAPRDPTYSSFFLKFARQFPQSGFCPVRHSPQAAFPSGYVGLVGCPAELFCQLVWSQPTLVSHGLYFMRFLGSRFW